MLSGSFVHGLGTGSGISHELDPEGLVLTVEHPSLLSGRRVLGVGFDTFRVFAKITVLAHGSGHDLLGILLCKRTCAHKNRHGNDHGISFGKARLPGSSCKNNYLTSRVTTYLTARRGLYSDPPPRMAPPTRADFDLLPAYLCFPSSSSDPVFDSLDSGSARSPSKSSGCTASGDPRGG